MALVLEHKVVWNITFAVKVERLIASTSTRKTELTVGNDFVHSVPSPGVGSKSTLSELAPGKKSKDRLKHYLQHFLFY